jgi:hypothetical protein
VVDLYQFITKRYRSVLKEIVFRPVSETVEKFVEKPIPAKKCIPDWFKKIPKYENNEYKILESNRANTTMKACMPFMDTFLTGYIQNTWTEIYIDSTSDDGIHFSYSSGPKIVDTRGSQQHYPSIKNFSKHEMVWQQPWIPQIPKGYSMIYTHPFNRYDLPFLSLSGIIDNDHYYMETAANHPFYVQKDFKGIIPLGTPMFQMIPIKRDVWQSFYDNFDSDLQISFRYLRKFFMDGYKKMYWQKKEYN